LSAGTLGEPPRVALSPVALECQYCQTVVLAVAWRMRPVARLG
jgi:hypothetical protein